LISPLATQAANAAARPSPRKPKPLVGSSSGTLKSDQLFRSFRLPRVARLRLGGGRASILGAILERKLTAGRDQRIVDIGAGGAVQRQEFGEFASHVVRDLGRGLVPRGFGGSVAGGS
jgi:hypothetical protein